MKKININQLVKLIGSLLAALALIFVGKSIWAQKAFFLNVSFYQIFRILVFGSIVYFFANVLLGIAWKLLLGWFGEYRLSLMENIGIYGRTQILKYIPGNVFFLSGRHVLSRRRGLDHDLLAGAAVFEMVGMLAASSFVSLLGILFTQRSNTQLPLVAALVTLIVALTSPLIVKFIFTREIVLKKISFFRTVKWGNYPRLMVAWIFYLFFFVLTGLTLLWTLIVIHGVWRAVPLPAIFSIYAISWFAGFITPGAPAGAGVRDGIMILILSNYIGESNSVMVSLIMRVITTLGDLIFYLFGLLINR